MEEKRPDQDPTREATPPADVTAARTRPIDAARIETDDETVVRRGHEKGDSARQAMAERGFGDHKGVEGF